MEAKAILYHSNKKEKCKNFISNTEYLISSGNSKDDKWLGKGMYFWDNKGNAHWWNSKQSKRNPQDEFVIVAVNVALNRMLDLTDYEIYKKLEELWQQVCKKSGLDSNVELGNKLNFLFDSFNFALEYDLIKVYGKYNYTPSDGIYKFDYANMQAEPTIGVKCIYNVKSVQCIIEREFVEEEKS